MAEAQTTLTLNDRLTGTLTKIMRAMDSTIRVMEQMNTATNNLDGRALASARRNISNASADLERLRTSLNNAGSGAEEAANHQNHFNNSLASGVSAAKSFVGGILAAIGVYKAFSVAKNTLTDMFSRGVEFHAFKQASEVAFTTFLGDAEKAKQYMDDMYAFALKTPFSYPDLLASSRNLIAFGIEAQNTFPIMQAIGDTVAAIGGGNQEMMGLADVFGAIQVSGKLSLEEVNRLGLYGVNAIEMLSKASGTSADQIKKNISDGSIGAGQAIETLVNGMNKKFGGLMEGVKGTWRGAVDTFNSALRNAGAKMMEKYMTPLTEALGVVTNLIKKIPDFIGPAIAAFIPLINMFNDTFGEDRFSGVFMAIGAAIAFTANILSWMGQAALWVAGIFADNWSWIAPILTVMGTVLGVIVGILLIKYAVLGMIRLATLAWAAAQWVVNSAYLSNPITWVLLIIVAIIALVIYAMVAWADQTATVIGYIVGSIYWLGAVFYNILMGIGNLGLYIAEFFVNTWNQAIYLVQMGWISFNLFVRIIFDAIGNLILRVAEFFINKWNEATYGVQMAFHKMQSFVLSVMSGMAQGAVGVVNSALGAISNLINGAVGGINKLISMANNIPGVNIGTVGTVDFKINNGVSAAINAVKQNLPAPTKAPSANLGRFSSASDYLSNVNLPNKPQSNANLGRLNYKDTSAAFSKGYNAGEKLSLKASDKLTGAVNKMTGLMSGKKNEGPNKAGKVPLGDLGGKNAPGAAGGGGKGGKNPNGGKLDKIGSVGKIDKGIQIADEDLEVFKELATRKYIQNFVTLTPTVSVQTGDLKSEVDVNALVKKIEKSMIDEIAISAEGAYS